MGILAVGAGTQVTVDGSKLAAASAGKGSPGADGSAGGPPLLHLG